MPLVGRRLVVRVHTRTKGAGGWCGHRPTWYVGAGAGSLVTGSAIRPRLHVIYLLLLLLRLGSIFLHELCEQLVYHQPGLLEAGLRHGEEAVVDILSKHLSLVGGLVLWLGGELLQKVSGVRDLLEGFYSCPVIIII